jgi:hypothetical protein
VALTIVMVVSGEYAQMTGTLFRYLGLLLVSSAAIWGGMKLRRLL